MRNVEPEYDLTPEVTFDYFVKVEKPRNECKIYVAPGTIHDKAHNTRTYL